MQRSITVWNVIILLLVAVAIRAGAIPSLPAAQHHPHHHRQLLANASSSSHPSQWLNAASSPAAAESPSPTDEAGPPAATIDEKMALKAKLIPAIFLTLDIGLPIFGLLIAAFVIRRRNAAAGDGSSVALMPITTHRTTPSPSHTALTLPPQQGSKDDAGLDPTTTPPATAVKAADATMAITDAANREAVRVTDPEAACKERAGGVKVQRTSMAATLRQALCTLLGLTASRAGPASASNTAAHLADCASVSMDDCLERLGTTVDGLTPEAAADRLALHGRNQLSCLKPQHWTATLFWCFVQPFNMVLVVLAALAAAPLPDSDFRTMSVMATMVVLSTVLRFIQERRSTVAAQALVSLVHTTSCVVRAGVASEIEVREVVVGDIVQLSAGDIVPADMRLITTNDLFISESSLTGECMPVEKRPGVSGAKNAPLEHDNILFMGTCTVSGTATAVVLATGDNTYVAQMASVLAQKRPPNAFDTGVKRMSFCLIAFMLVVAPLVILLNGLSTGKWIGANGAVGFGLSVAVGLTPELLPMIVTANLCRAALFMSKKKNIVRRMDSISNLGAMDVLCTDKTGTLTQDQVTLVRFFAPNNDEPCHTVLKYAYCNAFFQTGLKNLLDRGVIEVAKGEGWEEEVELWDKIDELPFDFERRRLSVLLQRKQGSDEERRPLLVCKGAIEEVLAHSTHARVGQSVLVIDQDMRSSLMSKTEELNRQGLRVLGVATRTIIKPLLNDVCKEDESDMCFQGFLAFLDPLKPSALGAIADLAQRGVEVKVLTGDNLAVTLNVCGQIGLPVNAFLTGPQIEVASDEEVMVMAQEASVFAKLSPHQKQRIVLALKQAGKVVGFLGDGTNDALALREADVGVSVDSGTDVAKEAADMVMLEKDLNILSMAVDQGRITQANTIKYVKMAISSNFGNVFSIVAASAWLPFSPMSNKQILALNLLYDLSQTTIPWDNVDASYVAAPRRWCAKGLAHFMLIVGPVSSIFDLITFLLNWYVYGYTNGDDEDQVAKATTSWFLLSLATQVFAVHMLRTEHVPFIQSRASWLVLTSTFGMLAVGFVLPFIPALQAFMPFARVPDVFYGQLVGLVAVYCICIQLVKTAYKRVFGKWL